MAEAPTPAILELPELRERVASWSVEEYENLVELGLIQKRGELIRGIIINKMPKPPLHCALAKWIYDWLMSLHLAGWVVFQERGLRLADSEPEPDISIVQGGARDFDAAHPTTAGLVIEIAVSSVAADREYAMLYSEAKVEEYWIILAATQQVEVRRRPVEGVYQELEIYRLQDTLNCRSISSIELHLPDLFSQAERGATAR